MQDWDLASLLFGEDVGATVKDIRTGAAKEAPAPAPVKEPPTQTRPGSGKWWPKHLPVLSFETWTKLRTTGGAIDKTLFSTSATVLTQKSAGPQGTVPMKMAVLIQLMTEVASAVGSPVKDVIDNWPHVRPDVLSEEYKKLVAEGVYEELTEEELAAARDAKNEIEYNKKSKAYDKAVGKMMADPNTAAMLQGKLLNAQGEERDVGRVHPIGVKIFKSDAVFRQNYTNLNLRASQSINPTFGRIGF